MKMDEKAPSLNDPYIKAQNGTIRRLISAAASRLAFHILIKSSFLLLPKQEIAGR